MRIHSFLLLLCFLVTNSTLGQEKLLDDYFESYIETMSEKDVNQDELILLWEDLAIRLATPLSIQSASEQSLQELNFLSFNQIKDILFYRQQVGKIYSIYELGTLTSINKNTLKLLSLFTTVDDLNAAQQKVKTRSSNSQLLFRFRTIFPKAKGFDKTEDATTVYSGNANQYYILYKGRLTKSIAAGLVVEKDIGEKLWATKEPEYYAGFAEYMGKGNLEPQIILGDYHLRIGQGISFWTGGSSSKPVSPDQLQRLNQGIRGYTSTNENQFFRGIAGVISWKQFKLTVIGSSKHRDANLSFDLQDNPIAFTSFQNSGLHRYDSEIIDRNSVCESWYGSQVEYQDSWFSVGLYYFRGCWNLPCIPKTTYPTIPKFEGKKINVTGGHYQIGKSGFQMFGELAMNNSKSASWINGLVANLHPLLEGSLVVRNYSPDFISMYGNSFGEQSSPKNEQGVCTSILFYPIKRLKLNAYIDFFKYPKPTSRVYAPSTGHEFLGIAEYDFGDEVDVVVRVKKEQKEENGDLFGGTVQLVPRVRNEFRQQVSYQINSQLRLRTRFEYVNYKKGEETRSEGFLGYFDLAWKGKTIPGVLNFRFNYFFTDDYNARIYSYENDVLYQFALPALYGEGVKSYLNLRYVLGNSFTIYSKVSLLYRFDTDAIGSGYDETFGSRRWEMKAMVRYTF